MDGVEILDEDDAGEPTEEEIIEYARFLDIDPDTEPHLMWIAKEGVAAPVPHPWKACTEDDEVFYFNFETSESIWDHPCDSHYKELLVEERKKHANGNATATQPSSGSPGISGSAVPVPDDDMDNSKSFVSEAVDSDDSKQSRSSSADSRAGANKSKEPVDDDESKSFVSEAVSVGSSPNVSPTAASSTTARPASDMPLNVSERNASSTTGCKDATGGDTISTPRSSRSSRSGSSAGSRNPPRREESRSPDSRHSSRSASWDSRGAGEDNRLQTAPYSPRSSRNSAEGDPVQEILASPKSSRSADSREKDSIALALNAASQSTHEISSAKFVDMKDDKADSATGQDSTSKSDSAPQPSPKSSKSSPQASPQGSDRPQPVLDHSGYSARSSNPSEISEDFHSDWGVLSPPGSARSGRFLSGGLDVQNSLEVSASVDTRSLDTDLSKSFGPLSGQDKHADKKEKLDRTLLGKSTKSWQSLEEDIRVLADALESIALIRSKQKEYLNIIKVDF